MEWGRVIICGKHCNRHSQHCHRKREALYHKLTLDLKLCHASTGRPDGMLQRKWKETKQQLIWWPDLALLGCCLVSLNLLYDILSGCPVFEHVRGKKECFVLIKHRLSRRPDGFFSWQKCLKHFRRGELLWQLHLLTWKGVCEGGREGVRQADTIFPSYELLPFCKTLLVQPRLRKRSLFVEFSSLFEDL